MKKTNESYSLEITPTRKLQRGDILFCKSTEREFGKIHCAMYLDNDEFIESMPFFGVRTANSDEIAPFWNLFYYGYIKTANEQVIEDAIDWAMKQIGCRYQYLQFQHSIANYSSKDRTDPFSNRWYCSELIWAAFMNASNNQINLSNTKKISGTKYHKVWVEDLEKDKDNIQMFCPKNPPLPIK